MQTHFVVLLSVVSLFYCRCEKLAKFINRKQPTSSDNSFPGLFLQKAKANNKSVTLTALAAFIIMPTKIPVNSDAIFFVHFNKRKISSQLAIEVSFAVTAYNSVTFKRNQF